MIILGCDGKMAGVGGGLRQDFQWGVGAAHRKCLVDQSHSGSDRVGGGLR